MHKRLFCFGKIKGMLFEIVMEGTSSGGHGVSVINEQRILIVDDDREFRRSLTKIFEKAGFQVNAASTGNQAGALLGKNAYGLIILCARRWPGPA